MTEVYDVVAMKHGHSSD